MSLATLDIASFRNLAQVRLHCAERLNLVTGANASGKTSFLEAIYFLSRGRSFRARQPRELIRHGTAALRVVARTRPGPEARGVTVGVAYDGLAAIARIDGAPARSVAERAACLPVLMLNPDSHRLLDDGPQQRRRFLDWGLFHGEPAFLGLWKRYQGFLRQRNAALRSGRDRALTAWDSGLAEAAARLDTLRRAYCDALNTALAPLAAALLGADRVTLDYHRGWSRERDLLELLQQELDSDQRQGHTRRGPHRADFSVRIEGQPASLQLSRGQQKLLVIALILAQARLFRDHRRQDCVLLVDDLPSELDTGNRQRVLEQLAAEALQLFVTAIEPTPVSVGAWSDARHWHFTEGRLEEVV